MSLKAKLKNNQLTIGSWITIGNSSVIEIMATAGFEWLCIDMEHTSIDLATAKMLITTIHANNMKALVRVSKNEEVAIKKVMDMGADGVVVPMVKSKEDAQMAIDFVKYPPVGKRGVGLYRAQNYGIGFDEYKKWVEEEAVIIAQIEHIEAVNNIEDIVDTDGIDGIIIGPYDLSGSMGFPGEYHRNDVKEAIAKVLRVCKEKNFPSGFHVIESDPTKLQERIDEGCTFLAYSLDFFFLGDSARYGKSLVNNHLKITYDNWNHKKKNLNEKKNLPSFQEREIVFITMGKNIGYEQDGKGADFLRPVLVLKRFNKEQFVGFAMTSKYHKQEKFYYKLKEDSYVILSQVKTYSAKRIKYKTGHKISPTKIKEISEKFMKLVTPQ